MTARCALDANILIYTYDDAAPDKQGRARALLERLGGTGAVIPAQALAETSRVLLVKRKPSLPPEDVSGFVARLVAAFTVVPLTEHIVMDAVRAVAAHGFSYFDAQIWAASRAAGATVLLTEDFQDGRETEGVCTVNPFMDAFDPATL